MLYEYNKQETLGWGCSIGPSITGNNLVLVSNRIHHKILHSEDAGMFGIDVGSVVPVAPAINIPELIQQSSIESGWERSLTGGGLLNHTQASKALCGLSQQVDRYKLIKILLSVCFCSIDGNMYQHFNFLAPFLSIINDGKLHIQTYD